ncbi:MAG: VWA domain-containing protein [Planctomycetota bacterium]
MKIHNQRKGNILALMCFLLPALFAVAAFTINLAYLQLSRTELMVATDAAARAGGRALSELQDVDDALEVARITAAMNTVSGESLIIDTDDNAGYVHFGLAQAADTSSRYSFTEYDIDEVRSGNIVANSLRITGNRVSGAGGAIQMPFPSFGLAEEVDVLSQSVAMQVDRDIALVLDRSGSMSWVDINWPSGYSPWNYDIYYEAYLAGVLDYDYYWGYYYASGYDSDSYQQWVWTEYYGEDELGPAPTTPWEDLVEAVGVFLDVLEDTIQTEQVSLSSYASTASTDLPLQTDYQNIIDELDTLSASGATAIGYGIQAGVPTLYDATYARPLAAKTVIVMTDGIHNTGTSPVTVTEDYIGQYDMTFHTITFSSGADQDLMQEVADIGGGMHYHANTSEELNEVFRQIANNLPTIITQ